MLLEADGQTPYYPSSPSATGSPLAADCSIPLNASGGAATSITIPHLAGARIWFSIGTPLTFTLNPGPALVETSVTNPSDPNINQQWDFTELTYNDAQLFANISMVDFVCIPVALNLTDSSGNQQTVQGLPAGGLDTACAGLTAQANADGQDWNSLIVTSNGQNLRAQPNQRHRDELVPVLGLLRQLRQPGLADVHVGDAQRSHPGILWNGYRAGDRRGADMSASAW